MSAAAFSPAAIMSRAEAYAAQQAEHLVGRPAAHTEPRSAEELLEEIREHG